MNTEIIRNFIFIILLFVNLSYASKFNNNLKIDNDFLKDLDSKLAPYLNIDLDKISQQNRVDAWNFLHSNKKQNLTIASSNLTANNKTQNINKTE